MKKYIIWGAGENCKQKMHNYRELRENTIGIVDMDPQKWNTNICGVLVSPVQWIEGKDAIILVSRLDKRIYHEVKRYLEVVVSLIGMLFD